ncbi:MAG: glycosyltransferase family 4 protein [bacterium]|nr:glycosyltransferase family 4 protein [bacterium]
MAESPTILIVNRRYFHSSGPERYMFEITKILERNGYTVAPFSVKRKQNLQSEYARYFVESPYGEDTLYFNDARFTVLQKLKIFCNCVYSFEAKRQMKRILRDKKIDAVYLLGIVNDISPSILHACRAAGVPVIMRLSDYNLLCGNYVFLRDGKECRLCVTKGPFQCVKHACVKKQFLPSFARALSMKVHNLLRIYDAVDYFVCPSRFMYESMRDAGYEEKKLRVINSFLAPEGYEPYYENDGYILYFGRIAHEKGLDCLIDALGALDAPPPLYLVGEPSESDYLESLKARIAALGVSHVTFFGFKSGAELKKIIRGAKFVVVPSICADNSPMSTIEAMALGKPVIASRVGGIPDQVTDECGILFEAGNAKELGKMIDALWNNDTEVARMGRNARRAFELKFSPEAHFEQLNELFQEVVHKRRKK